MKLKAFNESGTQLLEIDASGDAWGDGVSGPYGTEYPVAPGHYTLDAPQRWSEGDPAEGYGQIPFLDLTQKHVFALASAGLSKQVGSNLTIGDITLPVGMLAQFGRSEIMVHGGGSNLGLPAALAPHQPLLKTEGCTRVHNADWKTLAQLVDEWRVGHIIVWSAVGDPAPVSD
ncbi:MAG: hypothetical protein IAI49_14755 [Candidatus Eremiobacteraeota bacterium]|nr:hypothetical protein [Candidatus Eremiobacteraeota bacterium]